MKPFRKVSEFGFRADGSCYRSETPVDNAQTRFVRQLLATLHARPYCPAEVAAMIQAQPEFIRSMFNPIIMAAWAKLDAYEDWQGAPRSRSSESVIIDRGRGQPPWSEDDRAWHRRVAEAERLRPELKPKPRPRLPWDPKWLGTLSPPSPTVQP